MSVLHIYRCRVRVAHWRVDGGTWATPVRLSEAMGGGLIRWAGWGRVPLHKTLGDNPASKCILSSLWLPPIAHHLGDCCDCVAMTTPPAWPDPMPARTDMATASAARTFNPLMVALGLEAEAGGDGPCWITPAAEPTGSVEIPPWCSSPPAATGRESKIHP